MYIIAQRYKENKSDLIFSTDTDFFAISGAKLIQLRSMTVLPPPKQKLIPNNQKKRNADSPSLPKSISLLFMVEVMLE